MMLYIILAVWIIGIFVAYFAIINKWKNRTKFEKFWFSFFWPATVLAYGYHLIYKLLKKNDE